MQLKYICEKIQCLQGMRLGSDMSQDVTLGTITGRCLRQRRASSCAILLSLIAVPSLAGTLHMVCSEGCLPANIFGEKHWSQKCKQPGKCKYSICNAGALDLLNELCKGIVGLVFFFHTRGNIHYLNSFCCHRLVRAWFCRLSWWQL